MSGPEGFSEVVFSVSDLSVAAFYETVGGWAVIHRGRPDRRLLQLWGLSEDAVIEELLLRCPNEDRGFLRLLKIRNLEQRVIRAGARDWDPGGYFHLHVRTRDIEVTIEKIREWNWRQVGEPTKYYFNLFHVKECMFEIHDGIRLSIIQSYEPTFDIPEHIGFTALFNVGQNVANYERAKRFFLDQLRFRVYIETQIDGHYDGIRVLEMEDQDLPADYSLNTMLVHPQKNNLGSVELLHHKGLPMRSFAEDCAPPNLGHMLLRFPVDDLEHYYEEIVANGAEPKCKPMELYLSPFGPVKIFALQTPDGAWMEFFQRLDC